MIEGAAKTKPKNAARQQAAGDRRPVSGSQPLYPTRQFPFNTNPMPQLLDRDTRDYMRQQYTEHMWGRRIAYVMQECPIGTAKEGGEVGGYLIEPEPMVGQMLVKVVDRRSGQLRVLVAFAD